MLLGGLETGGTKMVCAIGDEQGNIIERVEIKTDAPEETMPKLIDFFKQYPIKALGISCFGPIDLNHKHDTYGYILKTTKVKWAMYNIVGAFKDALNIPVGFDTDVNGACLAEAIYGAGKGLDNLAYYTVGTGIGVGVYVGGKLQHGLLHPEGGHILVRRYEGDSYEGKCTFHHDCLEGMACGPAIEERFNTNPRNLVGNKDFIQMEAYYLAQGVCNTILSFSPERIIMGGGVMHIEGLIEEVRKDVVSMLNGYIQADEIINDIDNYIVLPGCEDNAGALGSLRLAYLAYTE